jgi:nickel superoxide dismutase
MMSFRLPTMLAAWGIVALASSAAWAHCQIPCGIYDDPARFTQMEEHVRTIEKSMKQIEALSEEAEPNWNQIVRWVTNKEAHADELTEIVTFYFLAQRIKPADPGDREAVTKYVRELRLLHEMMVHAMKAKQTTDLEQCVKLRDLIAKFRASYLGDDENGHAEHRHRAHSHAAHGHADHSHAGPSHAKGGHR